MALEVLHPDQLRGELKQGTFAPVYLLAGADGFRIERTARWMRDKVLAGPMGELNAASVWADQTPPGKIAQDAAAFPMFGGQRFLWVRHAESLPSGNAIEPLLRYLENPADSTVMLFSSSKLDKRLKFTTACARVGRVVEFGVLSGRELETQVTRQASGHGLQIDGGGIRTLTELVGEDLAEIDQELAKLALLADGRSIGAAEVRELVARSRAIDGFDLADAFDPSRPAHLLAGWMELQRRGTDAFGNAAILGWRLRQLVQLRELLDEGYPARDAASLAGLPPWQAKRLMPLVASHSGDALKKTLEAFVRADRRAKSSSLGAGLAWDLALLEWAAAGSGS